MTLDRLRAVEAVVTTGTFRAAADRLHKAQSAISHQVRKLEDELQFEIFFREAYRPSLTPRGEVFYREAVRILHHVRSLRATASGLRGEQEAEVRLSISATVPFEPLLNALAPVRDAYPATHIRVFSDMMGGPLSRLMRDEADLTVASQAGVPMDEVDSVLVCDMTIQPVCSTRLELADLPGVRSVAEMQTRLQIVVADTIGGNYEQSRDVTPGGRRWAVSDFQTKKAMLLSGLGWGGMPVHLIKNELVDGRLTVLKVEGFPSRTTELFAMRKRGKAVGRVQADIWEALKAFGNNSA